MLNKELEQTLNNAFVFAREHRHEFMTVEHLLLALLDNSAARDALKACGADIEAIKSELLAFVKDTTPLILDDQLNEREIPHAAARAGNRAWAEFRVRLTGHLK